MTESLASRGEEFNLGPETRLDHSELLCNKVLLKYKGDRESFWHRHQKGVERVPPILGSLSISFRWSLWYFFPCCSISTTPYQVVATLMIQTPWGWSFQIKYKYSIGCIYTKALFVVYLKFKITWMFCIFICQFYQPSLEGLTSVSRCQSLKTECKLSDFFPLK